ncbi:hypothetical protein [Hymenobacter perfusus]|uniref:Outer membrane protein beta-barrel domain-containing protein n=1 Tax=Hymenobacter perfusus TaxID=1236770 RepID=A0A3R9NYY1_9BACT|nr:hypothetical protein [Hymenobacter perfusus]RSK46577.1 hypothetical protein EI293_05315 [Hymenobacter perfusus]
MYRSFLLTMGLSMLALSAEAQITEGTKLLGGSVGYTRSTTTATYGNPSLPAVLREQEYTNRNLSISPQVGLFIADNVAAGLSVGYTSRKQTSPYYTGPAPDLYQRSVTGNSFRVAPYLRYYYMPTATFGVFGHLIASYDKWSDKYTDNAPGTSVGENQGHNIGLSIIPTMVFFPVEKVGLELAFGSIGYNRGSSTSGSSIPNGFEDKNVGSSFGANFGFNQLTLGASYYLSR